MIGMLESVQLAAQASYGTSNVVSLRAIQFISESFKHTVTQLQEASLYGRLGDSPRYAGKRASGGMIAFEPKPTPLNIALWAMCGLDSVSFTASLAQHKLRPLNTTEWDVNASPLQPFSVLLNRGVGSSMLYSDLVADQLKLSIKNGELLKADLTFVGGHYTDNANVAATFPVAENPWIWYQSSFSYGGAALFGIKDFDLTLKNNVEPRYTLEVNSGQPTRVVRKGFVTVDGKATLLFKSNSLMADFLAQTEKQLKVSWLSGSYQFLIDVPNLRWTDWDVSAGGPGLIEARATFVGDFESVNSNYAVEFTLTNTMAAYP